MERKNEDPTAIDRLPEGMEEPDVKKKKKDLPAVDCCLPAEQATVELLDTVSRLKQEMEAYYPRLLEGDRQAEATGKAQSMKRAAQNLTKAASQMYALQDELSGRVRDVRKQQQKNRLMAAPANASIDRQEEAQNHFARGLNGYKLLLICFIGSFFGVVVELIWCLLKNGYLESRSGLVYGPFNLLYGAGAVLLTVCLYRFRNRGAWLSFLGSIVVGSVLEYVCSWGQEFVFGSRSWDYSNMPFNINGRICLLYSVFWGFLGVLWIKNLYPRMVKWILKIPNKAGKIMTWALLAFFVVNTVMSGLALTRWSQRVRQIPPANAFWKKIDERFPDERMERIYANMEFGEK